MNTKQNNGRKGFTLIEILVVVGVIVVLAIAVLYVLNPHSLATEAQDGNRVAGIGTLDKAVSLYYSDALTNPTTLYMGSSSIIYVSVPDPTATTTAGTNCAGVGFPSSNTTYHCAASSTYLNTNGTGWVPINFASYSAGNPIASLPVDPINTASSGEYYVYVTNGTQYQLIANPASPKDASDTADFVKGSNLTLATFPGTMVGGSSGGENIWVADSGSDGRIEEFSAAGAYESQFGSVGSGNGQFRGPTGLTVDGSGNIWVVDQVNNRVQEFSATGTYESQFGSYGSSTGQLVNPWGVAINASGNFWVTDSGNNRVEEFSATGTYESQFGSEGTGNGQLHDPQGIAIDGSGNIWVVDDENYRVEEFSATGTYESQFGSFGSGNGQFGFGLDGIAIDGSGNILVVDNGNWRVQKFSSNGTYVSQFGSEGAGNGQLQGPEGIAVDGSGNIWVVDSGNNRVEEFSSTGTYESQFGSSGSGNGQFNEAYGIAI